jgi:hypothetical protein
MESKSPPSPKYAANVPASILTPDVVETERLGRLTFSDGMPSDETVRKVYDQLDFSRGVETFLSGCPANWVQTMPGRSWTTLFRLYAPLEPWFDGSWKPGDIELVGG